MAAIEADLRARIQELESELDSVRARAAAERERAARDATLLAESLERQTATGAILAIISRTPANLRVVLESIVQQAERLTGADIASIQSFKDGQLRGLARVRAGTVESPGAEEPPAPPGATSYRSITERRTIHIWGEPEDIAAEHPVSAEIFRRSDVRSALTVPLLRNGEAIGVLLVRKARPEPFSDQQVALLESLADQAVIAIENSRLFNELEQRNRDLADSLEQQMALSKVLQAISTSPTDPAEALNLVAQGAIRFAGVETASILQLHDQALYLVAQAGDELLDPARFEHLPLESTVNGRAVLEQQTIAIDDLAASVAQFPGAQSRGVAEGVRSMAAVPLMHQGRAIGTLNAIRRRMQPFTAQQLALLEVFASQAAIALENAQLFGELQESNGNLRESLEQQTAVAGVLQAISRSAFDLQPVLETLLEHACRLLASPLASLGVLQAGSVRWVASLHHGEPGEFTWSAPSEPLGQRGGINDEALRGGHTVSVHGGIAAITERYPVSAEIWREYGARGMPVGSAVVVPLLRGAEALGILYVRRPEVEPYTSQQVALLEVFANQAAIAIENSRLLEELRESNARLHEANAAKSHFLSAMSHELRTPLNAVIGYSEILAEDAADGGHDEMIPDLNRINSAGKHLLSLINNVLDISKIEAGKMELEVRDFAVSAVLAEVAAVVPPLMSTNGNQFSVDAAVDIGSMRSDPTKLRQCLLNLLSNAAKFTDHGTVTLSVRRQPNGPLDADAQGQYPPVGVGVDMAEHLYQSGDSLAFAVADNGIGISDEQLGRLFQSFTQAEAGTSSRYGGTGLGLALSREFARLMGGDITVESEPAKGSTFTLTLPVQVPFETAAAAL